MKIEVKVGVALVAVLATIYVALFYLPAQQQKKFGALLQQLNDSADKGDVAGVKSAMSRGIDAKPGLIRSQRGEGSLWLRVPPI
jgi:hypothetical protein